MTKEELLQRLTDIEWDDFEVKEALDKMPEPGRMNRIVSRFATSIQTSHSRTRRMRSSAI